MFLECGPNSGVLNNATKLELLQALQVYAKLLAKDSSGFDDIAEEDMTTEKLTTILKQLTSCTLPTLHSILVRLSYISVLLLVLCM